MNPEFESEVKALAASKLVNRNKLDEVVFYGSSSFRLWGSLNQDFPQVNCLNIAFGGSTIQDCIDYFDLLIARTNPKAIFFYAGDNDIGNGASSEEVMARFIELLDMIDAKFPNVPFTFLSIKPSPVRVEFLETIREVNGMIESYLDGIPGRTFVNIFDEMLVDGKPHKELFEEDMLHMNSKGYKIWKEKLESVM